MPELPVKCPDPNNKLIEKMNHKIQISRNIIILSMLFVAFLILSNLTAFKVAGFHLDGIRIVFPAALVFFPLTYFFNDVLTEVYGFKISRLVIWTGLACSAIFTAGCWLTVWIHPSHDWHFQKPYALVLDSSVRIFIASIVSYFVGEFVNSVILSRLKVLLSGRLLWLRAIGSTAIGVGFDSIIFCNLAFFHVLPTHVIWDMVLFQYVFKVAYETLAIPLTYLITGYLKKAEQVDCFDNGVKYNPFSLEVS